MYYVYFITNKLNGNYYVGRTNNLHERLLKHFAQLNKKNHPNHKFQKDFTTKEDFEITYIEVEDRDESFNLENEYLQLDDEKMYNIIKESKPQVCLDNHPDRVEILKNRQKTAKKINDSLTPEQRKERYARNGEANGMYGKTHTEEVKKAISELNKGNSYAKGSVRSEEHRKRLSEIASERVGELNPFYGKKHSEETKKKIAEKNKGRKPPNTKIVLIGEVEYESLTEAGRQLGVATGTVLNRIKSKNYPEYRYK